MRIKTLANEILEDIKANKEVSPANIEGLWSIVNKKVSEVVLSEASG